jgi:hypothetical protein
MKCTLFAQHPGSQPVRARVGACGSPIARPTAVDAPAAVGLRLIANAYRSWQPTDLAARTNGAFTMSTTRHTRTLGTRPT